jgi:hypothetical protein
MPEIRWTNGQEEYSREEINYMLETQRAMIYNDVKYLLIAQAEAKGKRGSLTKNGEEIAKALKDCRRVVF